jgi:hypothetical protein
LRIEKPGSIEGQNVEAGALHLDGLPINESNVNTRHTYALSGEARAACHRWVRQHLVELIHCNGVDAIAPVHKSHWRLSSADLAEMSFAVM